MANPLPRGPLELPKRPRWRDTTAPSADAAIVPAPSLSNDSGATRGEARTPELTEAEAHEIDDAPVYVPVVLTEPDTSHPVVSDVLRGPGAPGAAITAQTYAMPPAGLLDDEAHSTRAASGPASEPVSGHTAQQQDQQHGAPDPEQVAAIRHWLTQLAFMEQTLDQMDSILGKGAIPVVPELNDAPVPVPEHLIPRARLVFERQIAIAEEINRRLRSTEAEMALTRKVRETAMVDIPVFLDTRA